MQTSNRIGNPERFLKIQPALTTVAGGLLGTLVILTSVGAGALAAVILRALYPLRMQAQKMIATDTIHAIPVSLLGVLFAIGPHRFENPWALANWLNPGCINWWVFSYQITNQDNAEHSSGHAYPREHQAIQRINAIDSRRTQLN
tara:strand:- start:46 stop:480 length:435 start_codon:yes stop_codon:yes gene_type:complete